MTDLVSAFPAGVTAASTFNKALIFQRGQALGEEFRSKGCNVALGPVAGPLGRVPAGGRNWEGFSSDPYLTGVCMAETIRGIQGAGVIACAKHFILNEQENFRNFISSNADDRTMHELYLWPFADAVHAGVASIMCSYNRVNNSYACENSKLLNGLLKDELDFQGFVVSDWSATHSGVKSVLAGLDMTMPGDIIFNDEESYFGPNLTMAVVNGSIPESRLDDMVTRIMAAYFLVGQQNLVFNTSFTSWSDSSMTWEYFFAQENFGIINQHLDARQGSLHAINARQVAREGIVLLKNENRALPISGVQRLAVIGSDAGPSKYGSNGCPDRGCLNGTLGMGWGSGTCNYPHLITPLEAIQSVASQTVNFVLDDYAYDQINRTTISTDMCIVFIASDSGEGYITVDGNEGDRRNLTAWNNGDKLVLTVAEQCNNTIVVVHSVGQISYEAWIDHPNVTAVLLANLPGQESGLSLVDVLFGAVNPSGRLPYTVAREESDYPAQVIYNSTAIVPQDDFEEGLLIDYRAFDMRNITPRFEFGFGLSYTKFNYSSIHIGDVPPGIVLAPPEPTSSFSPFSAAAVDTKSLLFPTGFHSLKGYIYPWLETIPTSTSTYTETSIFPTSPAGGAPGGSSSLYDVLTTVTAVISNTGNMPGQEVAQLYVGIPYAGTPLKQLRGFEKLSLNPGESAVASFDLMVCLLP